MTYTITRRTARGQRGWHWCIDVTTNGRRSNFYCSKPHRWRLAAMWHLYAGQGRKSCQHARRLWADFSEQGIV